MSVSPSPDADADFLIFFSAHDVVHLSSSLFTPDWAHLLELLELEADPPRGQAATTTRTVRRLGFPRFPSSPPSPNRPV